MSNYNTEYQIRKSGTLSFLLLFMFSLQISISSAADQGDEKSKNIFLFLGRIFDGKSTVINYALGHTLGLVQESDIANGKIHSESLSQKDARANTKKKVVVVRKKNKDIAVAPVHIRGGGGKSLEKPIAYQHGKKNLYYVDTPPLYNESQNDKGNEKNIKLITDFIKPNDNVQAIILVVEANLVVVRSSIDTFIKVLKKLHSFLIEPASSIHAVHLLFNKVPHDFEPIQELSDTAEYLKEREDLIGCTMVELLLKHPHNIHCINPLDDEQKSWKKALAVIQEQAKQPIPNIFSSTERARLASQEKIKQQRQELDQQKGKISQLAAQNNKLTKELEKLKRQEVKTNRELSDLKRKSKEKDNTISSLKSEKSDLENQKMSMQNMLETPEYYKNKIKNLQIQLGNKEIEIKEATSQFKVKESEITQLQSNIRDLNEKINRNHDHVPNREKNTIPGKNIPLDTFQIVVICIICVLVGIVGWLGFKLHKVNKSAGRKEQ